MSKPACFPSFIDARAHGLLYFRETSYAWTFRVLKAPQPLTGYVVKLYPDGGYLDERGKEIIPHKRGSCDRLS